MRHYIAKNVLNCIQIYAFVFRVYTLHLDKTCLSIIMATCTVKMVNHSSSLFSFDADDDVVWGHCHYEGDVCVLGVL